LFLVLKVVKPLKLLEESTYKIAQGEFEPIEKLPPEKEIRDVFDSFNKMARRLRSREEQLVRSKKLAALGTMLAGVAHEVNNPLSNISSSCEILLEELEDGDREFQKALLTEVLGQVDKARSIILNLLEFSRSKELSTEPVKAREIIERSLSLVQSQMNPEIRVELHVDDSLLIQANRQRMEQVFVNLLSNAAHAIEGAGDVRVWTMPAQNGMVSIRVIDNGKGIPQEDLPKIFDPFFSTKDVGHGTGLGLFITHDIIVRHGGSISVKSVEGQGTSFCMLIPAA
jgi:signal transduction histidine kinase